MKTLPGRRWLLVALALHACAAFAQREIPAQILVTREAQDLYRASAGGNFYIKTMNCHEHVYSDRAGLRVNVITRGGLLSFRNGKACVVDKFLQEIEPSKLNLRKELF
jgi:hypothetical protein